jgi:hypothetical protein
MTPQSEVDHHRQESRVVQVVLSFLRPHTSDSSRYNLYGASLKMVLGGARWHEDENIDGDVVGMPVMSSAG